MGDAVPATDSERATPGARVGRSAGAVRRVRREEVGMGRAREGIEKKQRSDGAAGLSLSASP